MSVKDYSHPNEKMKNKPSSKDDVSKDDLKEPASYDLTGSDEDDWTPLIIAEKGHDPNLHPSLHWYGKQEEIEVPSYPLHEHEVIKPRDIIEKFSILKSMSEAEKEKLMTDLFHDEEEESVSPREQLEFYQHNKNWKNRLIAGDSLQIMNSLIQYEDMSGKVKTIYFDPPYGINYRSNFQLATDNMVVTENDKGLTKEHQMLSAFRDTWKHGIHSYLNYLHHRIKLSRELLSEDGSIFLQIGLENLHYVKNLLDEVFGEENMVSIITVQKATTSISTGISNIADYILWYNKNKSVAKEVTNNIYEKVNSKNDIRKSLTSTNTYVESLDYELEFNGKVYKTPVGRRWTVTKEGMERLMLAKRVQVTKDNLSFTIKGSDFMGSEINNIWELMTPRDKRYIVETSPKIIKRCITMSSNPGDLVLDITCGSGTTAVCAEELGRRWITCDTSRIAIHLAKTRLLSQKYPYYLLNDENNIDKDFQYDSIPYISMKTIARNENIKEGMSDEEIEAEIQRSAGRRNFLLEPLENENITRVSGPFQVEVLSSDINQIARSPQKEESESFGEIDAEDMEKSFLQQLENTGISVASGKEDKTVIKNIKRLNTNEIASATAEYNTQNGGEGDTKSARIVMGRTDQTMNYVIVEKAKDELRNQKEEPDALIFIAFGFTPEAITYINEMNEIPSNKTRFVPVNMNNDLQMTDLKKSGKENAEAFRLIGKPDVIAKPQGKKDIYTLELKGFDYLNMHKPGKITGGSPDKIAMWSIDTDYNGRVFMPDQVYFPNLINTPIGKHIKKEIGFKDKIEDKFMQKTTYPFKLRKHRRAAVKIIDNTAVESMAIIDFDKLEKEE